MNCTKESVGEEIKKKPFYETESMLWMCNENEYPDSLFTRHESVLLKIPKRGKINNSTLRKRRRSTKLIDKKLNKRFKEDLYDINNMVYFDKRVNGIESDKRQIKICIPEFKVISNEEYKEVNEVIEDDDEMRYTEMHRPYELAESCHKFLNGGQGLPKELKGGLKIKIKLPTTPNELPFLIL